MTARGEAPRGPDARLLLVDHWYSHAVGHVIEALRRCQGYHACDPELDVGLVLNGASPIELARCAPFVREVFGVPYTCFGTTESATRGGRCGASRATGTTSSTIRPSTEPEQMRRYEGLRRYYEAAHSALSGADRGGHRRPGAARVRAPSAATARAAGR